MHLDRRLLGWGVFFILLGAIPLAVRGGLLDEELVGKWPLLWPLLLIGWGIGLLLRRTPLEVVGGAIAAITFGVMGGGLIATGIGSIPAIGCSGGGNLQAFAAQSGSLDNGGRINIEFDCGKLAVSTSDGTGWRVDGSDRDGKGPRVSAGASTVEIKPGDREDGFVFDRGNDWHVTIPRSPSVDLGLTLNAGDGTLDLASAHIGSVNLTLNAGSLRLRMADTASLAIVNATINAGSATISLPGSLASADLSLNAGSLDVCVPAGSEMRIKWGGALGSQNLRAAGLQDRGGDVWTTPGYDGASTRMNLDVSANAGSFSLKIGGSCGA